MTGPAIRDHRVGEIIRQWVYACDLTAIQAAKAFGVSRGMIYRYLNMSSVPSRKRLLILREDGGRMKEMCDQLLSILVVRERYCYLRRYRDGKLIPVGRLVSKGVYLEHKTIEFAV